ncbi:MAG TPA: NAD(+)/NADH kinase [Micromonosporaceae bacterium]
MGVITTVGLVLHPARNSKPAIEAVVDWAAARSITVLGLPEEIDRIDCRADPADATELAARADLMVSLGGDGTMLRAMRLAADKATPVLGVNLGRLGFLAEIDVDDLPAALSAIDAGGYTVEPRSAVTTRLPDGSEMTAFNDIVLVRIPGHRLVAVAVSVDDQRFVSYAADAIIVATATGSTAYSFSAGGPIVSPTVEGFLVVPAAAHSAFNRALVLNSHESVHLELLPASGEVAVEVDGGVATHLSAGDSLTATAVPSAGRVVRLGRTTFYQRALRKLQLTGSAEVD